ncbi:MAG: hypothetical protein H6741_14355 [Alphaproteobacteria bacterium]|nr:hypothetical protein [Alphaproteobacteria bacterium]MCB9793898.1 hypothetical protein [Alphaproteobacteria bacterium]
MSFKPLRLLIAYDPEGGLCARVVPRMKQLLEDRAFEVDVMEITDDPQPVDLYECAGLVLGTPAFGLGWRGVGPTERVARWVKAQADELDEVRVAVFCVAQTRPGWTLRNTRQLVRDLGGEVVCSQAYAAWNPSHEEHVLPAECMVRIR